MATVCGVSCLWALIILFLLIFQTTDINLSGTAATEDHRSNCVLQASELADSIIRTSLAGSHSDCVVAVLPYCLAGGCR